MMKVTCNRDCKLQFLPSYEIIESITENCKEELLTNLVYQFLIETDVDKLISTILNDIKNSDNQLNLTSDALILIVVSLNCIKDLYVKIFDIYLNKWLSYTNLCIEGEHTCELSYQEVVDKFKVLLSKYKKKFKDKIIMKTYSEFMSDVFLDKYYSNCFNKLDILHRKLEENDFDDVSVSIFMKTLQTFFYTLIVTNVWFIVELNQYYKSDSTEVTFYINSRFYNFYFNEEFKLDYVDNFIEYVIDKDKINTIRLYNLLNVGLSTYYPILKDKIKNTFENHNISNIKIIDMYCT